MVGKWHGAIGFMDTVEAKPGVWKEVIVERKYFGDILRNSRRWESSDKVNADITLSNTISIVTDKYAIENFGAMRYVEFGGSKWKINNIELKHHRIELTIGGLFDAE